MDRFIRLLARRYSQTNDVNDAIKLADAVLRATQLPDIDTKIKVEADTIAITNIHDIINITPSPLTLTPRECISLMEEAGALSSITSVDLYVFYLNWDDTWEVIETASQEAPVPSLRMMARNLLSYLSDLRADGVLWAGIWIF